MVGLIQFTKVMRYEYRSDFPSWVDDNSTQFDLCLTDDIDSLLSCVYLKLIKGYDINYFYDFKGLYFLRDTGNKAIGVDMDITEGKAWGNHVIKISPHDSYNKEIANLNVSENISRKNYTRKYCGSTLLTIMSYYGIDLSNISEEGKMILLAIDGGYSPFYKSSFKEVGKKWLVNVLEYEDLYETINRHSKYDFMQVSSKYGLHKKIYLHDGKLQTDIDLKGISQALGGLEIVLPNGIFTRGSSFKNLSHDLSDDTDYCLTKDYLKLKFFSLSITNRHFMKFSVLN